MIIRNKFSGYSADGVRIYPMDGGGGGGQQQTTTSDVASWAQPTAQRALGKAEALATDKPYQSYTDWAQQQGIDPNRVAGFTPLQQQSFQGAGSLTPSAAGDMGAGLAGIASMRALGTGYNPYQTGQFTGGAASQYMSPYLEQAMAPQIREATRQSDIQRNADNARAVGMGAFGGSRQAIVDAERERNLGTQIGDIRAQGYQNAFNNAQQQFNTEQQLREQSRQYGAGLGMQGLQAALQGAGQLGQLGAQQFGQQKDVLNLQNQFGGQQQANQQAQLGYNMQDYTSAQQYPYQQLSWLSNIIHGLPTGSVQTMYAAQPTTAQTIGSLGLGAYGLSQLARAGGGTVSSYADGGSVESPQNIEAIVSKLSDAQLQQAAKSAQARGDAQELQAIQQEMAMRASERGGIAGAFNQLPYTQQEKMMAGGGVVAFSGDDTENEDDSGQLVGGLQGLMASSEGNPEVYKQLTGYFPALLANVAKSKYTPMTDEAYNSAIAARRKALEEGAGPSPYEDIKSRIAELRGEGEKDLAQGKGLAALQAAAALSQGRGLMQGLGRAGGAFAESYGKALQADSAQKRAMMNMEINMADAQRKERMGLNREAISAADQARRDHAAAQEFGIKKASALANVAGKFAQATKPTKAAGAGASAKEFIVGPEAYAGQLKAEHPDWSPTKIKAEAFKMYQQQKSAGLPGVEARVGAQEGATDVKLGETITKELDRVRVTPEYLKATPQEKQLLLDEAAARVRRNSNRNSPRVNQNSTPPGNPGYSSLWE